MKSSQEADVTALDKFFKGLSESMNTATVVDPTGIGSFEVIYD